MAKRGKAQRAAIAIQKKKASLVTAGKRKGKRSSTFMNGHNMDHNGDGKITGIDFKIMNRAKKQRARKMKPKMGGVTKSSAKSWGATSRFIGNINGLKICFGGNVFFVVGKQTLRSSSSSHGGILQTKANGTTTPVDEEPRRYRWHIRQ